MKPIYKSDKFCDEVQVVPCIDVGEIIRNKIETEPVDDDPFFVCNVADIVAKHMRWLKQFPRIKPHYAIKCNPNPIMLQVLVAMGTGFDCASKSEILEVLNLGVEPDRIIYANPCKQASHVRYARDSNVNLIVFDNEQELIKMKKYYPSAKLVLRIQTDDSASVCQFSLKYGAHIQSSPKLIETAVKMGLNVVGISFHVGSGCQDVNAFVKALDNARSLFDYAESLGIVFTLLDIGGGFPGTDDVSLTFEKIASVVNSNLERLFPIAQNCHVKVIAEPGRYYAASAFTLTTNIIAKREIARDTVTNNNTGSILNTVTPTKNDEPAYMYYINDGLYGSFNCLFYDHAVVKPTLINQKTKNEAVYSSSIWGPTCDGLDRILEHVLLPELQQQNWIVWKDMGAYTVAAGSAFNGFKTTRMLYFITEDYLKQLNMLGGVVAFEKITFLKSENAIQVCFVECLSIADMHGNKSIKNSLLANVKELLKY